ncbi:MAG TPA: hypothetical protein VHO94_01690 [Oscillospiraceae bacterium]|nr:hypothetical protein [Oscillospiraceae bacterium]
MAKENRSEAYDLSLFEPKRLDQPQQKDNIIEIPQEKLEKSRKSKVRPVRAIGGFLALAIMLGVVTSMVYSQVQLTELTEELNTANKQLSENQSVYTQLKMKSDSQLSLNSIENEAKNKLGMIKLEQNQMEFVSLSQGDKGQVIQNNQGENWWTSIWHSIEKVLS